MSDTLREPRRAYRDPEDRFVAGVASGVAQHLGIDTTVVRIAFLVMVLWGGFGLLLYAALWAFLPVRDQTWADESLAPGLAAAGRRGLRPAGRMQRRDVGVLVSIALVGLGMLVLLQNAGLWISPRLFWPLLVAAAGLALLWWQSDESARSDWLSTSRGWKSWLRVLVGIGLLVVAVSLALFQAGVTSALGDVLVVLVLAVLGAGLVIGPWLFRAQRDLRRERAERIRTQERGDVAAHLHDSVLQTLALIQRQAQDPQAVAQLARTQERELRTWLFDSPTHGADTVKSLLQGVVGEIEDAHQVPIELVVVGDVPADAGVRTVVAASREAMANAARHSGAGRVDVFAEVGTRGVEVFVRDRGVGFEPASVPPDRLGVRRSIIDRVERHGGTAEVRSSPGNGTEVRLAMPFAATKQEDAQ